MGEIALVADRPRTATVVAMTPVSVAVIGRRKFHALLDRVTALAVQIRAAADERLADLEAQPDPPVDGASVG